MTPVVVVEVAVVVVMVETVDDMVVFNNIDGMAGLVK